MGRLERRGAMELYLTGRIRPTDDVEKRLEGRRAPCSAIAAR